MKMYWFTNGEAVSSSSLPDIVSKKRAGEEMHIPFLVNGPLKISKRWEPELMMSRDGRPARVVFRASTVGTA
jgi:hypothetical protein